LPDDAPAHGIHPVDRSDPLIVGDDEEDVRHAFGSPSEYGYLLIDNHSSEGETPMASTHVAAPD
jgi:hypothetical protein